ncbi:MAG: hypothetical protein HONBIEJF_02729 [Fimbriimonadaceae bacterium]|nr:hypothetical protein [Fimbriimonadaceae bacterium]
MKLSISTTLAAIALSVAAQAEELLVNDLLGDQILRYDADTGGFLGIFASGPLIDGPQGIAVGPDGNVYVASEYSANVTKWSPSGAFLGEFVSPGEGGLMGEQDLEFGPDGNLYVMSHITLVDDSVWKFDGVTGDFLGMHGLGGGHAHTHGMSWRAADGDLYQGYLNGPWGVKHFDGTTGIEEGFFTLSEHMAITNDILWGPDDDLYVSNPLIDGVPAGGILRFDGASGAYLGVFSDVGMPVSTWGMGFRGDYFYYSAGSAIVRVSAATGGTASLFVPPGSGGMIHASNFAWIVPEPSSIAAVLMGIATLLRRRRVAR